MYESSREKHTRIDQHGESRSRYLSSSTNDRNSRTKELKQEGPFVEISSSANTSRSWESFDSSPPKISAYASNTHKRLSSYSPEKYPHGSNKRKKEATPPVTTVEPAIKAAFTARLTKSSAVYFLDEESIPDSKDDLPKVIRERLERWYTRYGRSVPPCASMTQIRPSRSDDTCEWSHIPTGEKLHVSVYTMNKANDPRPSHGHAKRLIIAKGRTQGPFIIQFFDIGTSRKNVRVSRFRIWHGVDSGSALFAGDRDGFEHLPSVAKTMFQQCLPEDFEPSDDEDEDEDEDEDPISAQIPRSRRGIAGLHRTIESSRPPLSSKPGLENSRLSSRTDDKNASRAGNATAGSVERSPGCSGVLKRPKKLEALLRGSKIQDSHAGQLQPTSHLPSSSDSRTRHDSSSPLTYPYQHIPPTPLGQERTTSLSQHIRSNTEFWFLPLHNAHPPRIRPYHTCNTAKNLFGHARTARVFDPSPDIANVLTIRMWDDAEAMTLMEEDDPKFREQDYEAFEVSLQEAKCWIWLDGRWTGNCTVEVKAMQ